MKRQSDGFYSSQTWKQKRAHILRRDAYKDQLELRAGRTIPATLVHHILPRDKYPEYALEEWNLISISEETHRELHTLFGELTDAGKQLMLETAHQHDIKLSKLILVIGLPGTGKTTYVKQHLQDGLAYDLDYISAAFRLAMPKKEGSTAARKMANSMVRAFAVNAQRYSSTVYIIRTAPKTEEIEAIEPEKIIVMKKQFIPCRLPNERELTERIEEAQAWAEANGVPVTVL